MEKSRRGGGGANFGNHINFKYKIKNGCCWSLCGHAQHDHAVTNNNPQSFSGVSSMIVLRDGAHVAVHSVGGSPVIQQTDATLEGNMLAVPQPEWSAYQTANES